MRISVVIPVLNGGTTLAQCLRALAESAHKPHECIVVDDGSTDNSGAIAKQFGAKLVSTAGPFGPARARNLGAHEATGDVLVFLDADVAVYPDTLPRMAERFKREPALNALIGAYDDSPADPGFVSQFKNLMHSFVHRTGNRETFSFWCGCGAVRRSVYIQHGGLDESYARPAVEDIEFGLRLMRAGGKLALDSQIQCKHLKAWTLWNLVRTDVFDRGIPWTELILRTRFLPDDLNLSWSQRICVILSAILLMLCGVGLWQATAHGAGSAVAWCAAGIGSILALIGAINRRFYSFLASRRGWLFAVNSVFLHVLYYLYSGASFVLGVGTYLVGAVTSPSKVVLAGRTEDAP